MQKQQIQKEDTPGHVPESDLQLQKLSPKERHDALVKNLSNYYYSRTDDTGIKNFETDEHVLRNSYRFIRTEDDDMQQAPWVVKMARTYYSKLFREYALVDVSKAEDKGVVGLRWRSHKETVQGKGQFICGAIDCDEHAQLASYELPFKYKEAGEKKVALVKVRVCPECSRKLLAARRDASASRQRKRKKSQDDDMFTGMFD